MLIKCKNPDLYRALIDRYIAEGMAPYEARTYAFFRSQANA